MKTLKEDGAKRSQQAVKIFVLIYQSVKHQEPMESCVGEIEMLLKEFEMMVESALYRKETNKRRQQDIPRR